MIQDGITRWASKLTPSLKSKAEIEAHLSIIKAKVSLDSLRDCVILGLTYYTGARPVQLANFMPAIYIGTLKMKRAIAILSCSRSPKKQKRTHIRY
ncbi:hypothetical protein CMV05_18715 [Vibrio anguillarum]|nr:hypothetical protein CMV05_18715 [Vibrio anguillarum]